MSNLNKVAIQQSIEHWVRMRDRTDWDNAFPEKPEVRDCKLCALYYDEYCDGCPISNKTGKRICVCTPFDLASYYWWEAEYTKGQDTYILGWSYHAQQMINFLEGLLDDYS